MKPISELPFLRQYDKLIAVVVLIGLVVSLFYLTSAGMSRESDEAEFMQGLTNLKPAGKALGPADMSTYNEAASLAKRAPLLTLPVSGKAGFITPERRVICVNENCRKPIPYASINCPFCGQKQPPTPENPSPDMDSDGDGIPDKDEDKLGLNRNVAADAELDMDNDGFNNLTEFLAKTDLKDPKSHPPLVSLLRVKSIQSIKIPFVFTSLNIMPQNKLQAVFNTITPRRTFWVEEGEPISDTGWVVIKIEKKSEKRKNPNMGNVMQTVDISTVVVKRKSDNKEVTMRINEGRKDTDVEATIVLPLDQSEYAAVEGGTFKVREETYRVVAVNKETSSVTVENKSTGKTKIITKLD